mmetsp:Transcript_86949/g.261215  ORF Transcript_86949/g.261215 Transcript_86949/m.261215 type:complete len:282 (+) Transcript_86949:64-909(+)
MGQLAGPRVQVGPQPARGGQRGHTRRRRVALRAQGQAWQGGLRRRLPRRRARDGPEGGDQGPQLRRAAQGDDRGRGVRDAPHRPPCEHRRAAGRRLGQAGQRERQGRGVAGDGPGVGRRALRAARRRGRLLRAAGRLRPAAGGARHLPFALARHRAPRHQTRERRLRRQGERRGREADRLRHGGPARGGGPEGQGRRPHRHLELLGARAARTGAVRLCSRHVVARRAHVHPARRLPPVRPGGRGDRAGDPGEHEGGPHRVRLRRVERRLRPGEDARAADAL